MLRLYFCIFAVLSSECYALYGSCPTNNGAASSLDLRHFSDEETLLYLYHVAEARWDNARAFCEAKAMELAEWNTVAKRDKIETWAGGFNAKLWSGLHNTNGVSCNESTCDNQLKWFHSDTFFAQSHLTSSITTDGSDKPCMQYQEGYTVIATACDSELAYLVCQCVYGSADGAWSQWYGWTTCSVTCGGGTRTRDRRCDSPARRGSGNDCSGVSQESQTCNEAECIGYASCPTTHNDAGAMDIRHVSGEDPADTYFYLFQLDKTWDDARAHCEAETWELADWNSHERINLIESFAGNGFDLWTALHNTNGASCNKDTCSYQLRWFHTGNFFSLSYETSSIVTQGSLKKCMQYEEGFKVTAKYCDSDTAHFVCQCSVANTVTCGNPPHVDTAANGTGIDQTEGSQIR